jgi:hypothetical protein
MSDLLQVLEGDEGFTRLANNTHANHIGETTPEEQAYLGNLPTPPVSEADQVSALYLASHSNALAVKLGAKHGIDKLHADGLNNPVVMQRQLNQHSDEGLRLLLDYLAVLKHASELVNR